MPTEELFGAYHFLVEDNDADHFEFKAASTAETQGKNHMGWVNVNFVGPSEKPSAGVETTESLTVSYNKIEWTYATSEVDDFAF